MRVALKEMIRLPDAWLTEADGWSAEDLASPTLTTLEMALALTPGADACAGAMENGGLAASTSPVSAMLISAMV